MEVSALSWLLKMISNTHRYAVVIVVHGPIISCMYPESGRVGLQGCSIFSHEKHSFTRIAIFHSD